MAAVTVVTITSLLMMGYFFVVNGDPSFTFDIDCKENSLVGEWEMPQDDDRDVVITLIDTACNSTDDDPSPRSFTVTEANKTTMNITTTFNECSTVIEETNTSVIVKNTAILNVTTDSGVTYHSYDMFCEMERDKVLSAGDSDHLNVSDNVVVSSTSDLSKKFALGLTMGLYTDDGFTQKRDSSSITVNINEMIYVGITETNVNANFKFVVDQCLASPTTDFETISSDIFFNNKCSLDPTFSIKSAENSNDEFNFAIQAFDFIAENTVVYLQCKIYICLTDSTSPICRQTCDNTGERWRRDADSGGPIKQIVVTSPKIIFNDKQTCAETMCTINSKCYPLRPAVCICDEGYVFSRIKKKCVDGRLIVIKDIHLNILCQPEYLNTSSHEHHKFSVRYEKLFYRLFMATGATYEIEGVKIIKVRRGYGVILDIAIIRAATSTIFEAYSSFLNSLQTDDIKAVRVLQLIKYNKLSSSSSVAKETSEKMMWIILIGVILSILGIFGTIKYTIKQMKKRRSTTTNHNFGDKALGEKEP